MPRKVLAEAIACEILAEPDKALMVEVVRIPRGDRDGWCHRWSDPLWLEVDSQTHGHVCLLVTHSVDGDVARGVDLSAEAAGEADGWTTEAEAPGQDCDPDPDWVQHAVDGDDDSSYERDESSYTLAVDEVAGELRNQLLTQLRARMQDYSLVATDDANRTVLRALWSVAAENLADHVVDKLTTNLMSVEAQVKFTPYAYPPGYVVGKMSV